MQLPSAFGHARLRMPHVRLRVPRPSRRRVVTTIVALVIIGVVAWLLAVVSPLAHARDVDVLGVSGPDASGIRSALTEVGEDQSTFDVNHAALLAAVAQYPQVAAITSVSHPPTRLELHVVMRQPVAVTLIAGQRVVLAGDGTVLRSSGGRSLPMLAFTTPRVAGKITAPAARSALRVAAAAPLALLSMTRTIRVGPDGLEVVLTRGPRLIFGSSAQAHAKWAAAAAVIATGSIQAATYIDVRVPHRPAVGGVGVTASDSEAETSVLGLQPIAGSPTTSTDSTSTSSGAGTGGTSSDTSTQSTGAASTGGTSTGTAPSDPAPSAATQSATGAAGTGATQTDTAPSTATGTSTGGAGGGGASPLG